MQEDKIIKDIAKDLLCSEEEVKHCLPPKYIGTPHLLNLINNKLTASSISHLLKGERKISLFKKDSHPYVYNFNKRWFFRLESVCISLIEEYQNEKTKWIIERIKQQKSDKNDDWMGLRYKKSYTPQELGQIFWFTPHTLRKTFSLTFGIENVKTSRMFNISQDKILEFLVKSSYDFQMYQTNRKRRKAIKVK